MKNLTPTYKKIVQMIEQVIRCTEKFTRETLLGRLEVAKIILRQTGYFPRIETTFNALSV